jgi:S1-C subfamily serine protease
MIRTFDANGRSLAQGSGFLLEDRRVVTNTHVVRGAANVEILDSTGRLIGTTQRAEALSNSVDLAILPAVRTDNAGLPLAAGDPLVGTAIIVIGAPEGLQNTVSDDIVSAVRTVESQRLVQISAAISEGSSGGPVVNMNGEVIGVAVSSVEDGQNLNFAIPADSVAVLASSPAGQIEFGTVTSIAEPTIRGLPLPYDETVSSDLNTSLPQLNDGSYYEVWNFEGEQGQRIRLEMHSDAFDSFLILGRNADGRFIRVAVNDDRGPFNRDSRLNFTLPADGEYVVYATSFYGGAQGAYTLTLEDR